MVMEGWMDKYTVVHPYDGILFSRTPQHEWTLKNYAEWNVRHKRTPTVWFPFCEVHRRVKSIEAERRTVVARGGGRGNGNYCSRGQSFSWGGWESSQGGWRWWLYNGNVLNSTEAYSYKWLKWSILGCIYFTTTKDLAQEDVLKEIILKLRPEGWEGIR